MAAAPTMKPDSLDKQLARAAVMLAHGDFGAARALLLWAKAAEPVPPQATEEPWECENGCGFRHVDFDTVDQHERSCGFHAAAAADGPPPAQSSVLSWSGGLHPAERELQQIDQRAEAAFLEAMGIMHSGDQLAGVRQLLRCLRLSPAHQQAQQVLAGVGGQEMGGLKSELLLLGFNPSAKRVRSAMPDPGKLVFAFRAEFDCQGAVCVLLPSRGTVRFSEIIATAVGIAGEVVVTDRQGLGLGQELPWEYLSSGGSWLSVRSTTMGAPQRLFVSEPQWPRRRCNDALVKSSCRRVVWNETAQVSETLQSRCCKGAISHCLLLPFESTACSDQWLKGNGGGM